jgi:hypothetical protein
VEDERTGRTVAMKTDQNVEKGENSCENKSSFRHQSDSGRVE